MTRRRMGPACAESTPRIEKKYSGGNDGFAYNYWMTLEPHVHPDRISRLRS